MLPRVLTCSREMLTCRSVMYIEVAFDHWIMFNIELLPK